MIRLRTALPLLVAAALPFQVAGCNPKPIGQIVLVVQTDLSIPKDIDTIRIQAFNNGELKFQEDYDKIGPDSDEIRLPGTISLVASNNPADVITIVVSASTGDIDLGGVPRVIRTVVTTIPPDRVAMLPLGIHFLCYGQVTAGAAGTCADGQSCIGGVCQGSTLDSTTLTDYAPSAVTGNGSCFDGASCWTAPTVATVASDCSIPPVTGVNIALQTATLGICGPAGCFVTLDANDPVEGWTTRKDGRIQLPAGVCVQIANKQVINVVTQPVGGGNCGQKQLSLPTCGPWSAAIGNPPAYTGPQAVIGGQARPVDLAVLPGSPADTLYWTNGGVAPSVGAAVPPSLESITSSGGTLAGVAATQSKAPRSLIVVDQNLVWTDAPGTAGTGSIFQWDGTTEKVLVPTLDSPEGITSVGGKLFWTDFQDGAIYTAATDGTGVAKLVGTANYPFRVAADNKYVYWTNEGTAGMTPPDGSVARYQYTAATGVIETVAAAQETPRAIAIDGSPQATAVYFANFAAMGSITRVQLGVSGPAAPEVLADNQSYPNGLAVDSGYVYWTNRGDGTVNRLSTSAPVNTAPKVLASGQLAPGNLVVGDSYIYWVNEGSSSAATGAVVKLAK
jgi:hypothetical protein